MGFFSSRRAEDDVYQVTVGLGGKGGGGNDKSVVQVIRSRFYGKKGKEREDQQPAASFLGGVSAAQALSNNSTLAITTSNRSNHNNHHSAPSTPIKKTPNDITQPLSPSSSRPSGFSPLRKNITDTFTITLAQRLDELAVANSDGLLNDDEYRLLRQNLFERFASNSAVPTEAPVVPVTSAHLRPKNNRQTPERPTSRPLSNFQIDAPRPCSKDSRISATSSVASIFHRATSRRIVPKEPSDVSSVWSATSNNSSFFKLPRVLSKKSSNSSIRTNTSRIQVDTVSTSPRQSNPSSDRGHGDGPPQFSRSTASIRHLATPPSSYPARIIGQDNRVTNSIYNVFDEEHLKTVKEITQEIQNVEAEARRLMDAFNGLEVTTLSKLQRHYIRPLLKSVDFGKGSPESHWSPESESRSQRRIGLMDDAISMRSGTSAGTTPSVSASLSRSAHSTKKATPRTTKASSLAVSHCSRSGSLHRKNSTSSLSSGGRPVPTLPGSISHGHLKAVNSSNISLVRSTGHLPMDTVMEDEKVSMLNPVRLEPEDVENEMEDIQRRREEVSLRYEARLEYLRAKLKGAQLHEKLMRQ